MIPSSGMRYDDDLCVFAENWAFDDTVDDIGANSNAAQVELINNMQNSIPSPLTQIPTREVYQEAPPALSPENADPRTFITLSSQPFQQQIVQQPQIHQNIIAPPPNVLNMDFNPNDMTMMSVHSTSPIIQSSQIDYQHMQASTSTLQFNTTGFSQPNTGNGTIYALQNTGNGTLYTFVPTTSPNQIQGGYQTFNGQQLIAPFVTAAPQLHHQQILSQPVIQTGKDTVILQQSQHLSNQLHNQSLMANQLQSVMQRRNVGTNNNRQNLIQHSTQASTSSAPARKRQRNLQPRNGQNKRNSDQCPILKSALTTNNRVLQSSQQNAKQMEMRVSAELAKELNKICKEIDDLTEMQERYQMDNSERLKQLRDQQASILLGEFSRNCGTPQQNRLNSSAHNHQEQLIISSSAQQQVLHQIQPSTSFEQSHIYDTHQIQCQGGYQILQCQQPPLGNFDSRYDQVLHLQPVQNDVSNKQYAAYQQQQQQQQHPPQQPQQICARYVQGGLQTFSTSPAPLQPLPHTSLSSTIPVTYERPPQVQREIFIRNEFEIAERTFLPPSLPSLVEVAKTVKNRKENRLTRLKAFFDEKISSLSDADKVEPFENIQDALNALCPYLLQYERDMDPKLVDEIDEEIKRRHSRVFDRKKHAEQRLLQNDVEHLINIEPKCLSNHLYYADIECERQQLKNEIDEYKTKLKLIDFEIPCETLDRLERYRSTECKTECEYDCHDFDPQKFRDLLKVLREEEESEKIFLEQETIRISSEKKEFHEDQARSDYSEATDSDEIVKETVQQLEEEQGRVDESGIFQGNAVTHKIRTKIEKISMEECSSPIYECRSRCTSTSSRSHMSNENKLKGEEGFLKEGKRNEKDDLCEEESNFFLETFEDHKSENNSLRHNNEIVCEVESESQENKDPSLKVKLSLKTSLQKKSLAVQNHSKKQIEASERIEPIRLRKRKAAGRSDDKKVRWERVNGVMQETLIEGNVAKKVDKKSNLDNEQQPLVIRLRRGIIAKPEMDSVPSRPNSEPNTSSSTNHKHVKMLIRLCQETPAQSKCEILSEVNEEFNVISNEVRIEPARKRKRKNSSNRSKMNLKDVSMMVMERPSSNPDSQKVMVEFTPPSDDNVQENELRSLTDDFLNHMRQSQ